MSKRILVVEDQEDNGQIVRDMLSATDYEITEAENGEQALAAVAKQRPDLVLMDIKGVLDPLATSGQEKMSRRSVAFTILCTSEGRHGEAAHRICNGK